MTRTPLWRLGITEATEWIERAEKTSAESVSFSAFSDSSLGRWLDARLSADLEQSDVVHDLQPHIAATDRLIDLIVYRLYGLTADELAVVEGQA